MSIIEKRLFHFEPLTKDTKDYLFEKLLRHVQTTILLAYLTATALMLFELDRPAMIMIWLLPMIVLQALRYVIATKALDTQSSNLRTFFLIVDYVTVGWWVAYIYIFGWQTTSTFEYTFRTFMIYIIITFYLNVMLFHLPNLLINSAILCFGISIYCFMFTQLPDDFKYSMVLLTTFGLTALMFFGRMSNILAIESGKLLEKNQQLITKLDSLLVKDELTKQPNRRYFNLELSKHFLYYRQNNQPFCLAIVDIDFFKKVNDTYGHDIGDEVLISLSKFIHSQIRSTDVFARYGGEEFVIIFPSTRQQVCREVLYKVRANCAANKFIIDNLELTLTISIGITEVEEKDNETTIFKRADKALYQAKQGGRNCLNSIQTEHYMHQQAE